MVGLRQDLAHAWRVFRRAPLFFGALVVTLALGVGANGAVFGILRAVLLQPLPYYEPDRVVMLWRARQHPPATSADLLHPTVQRGTPSGGMALAIRDEAKDVLSGVATYLSWQGNLEAQFDLTLNDRAERLRGALATPNFFDVLGVTAARGRLFTAADASSEESLIVLSDALWHRAFGADPTVIGRPLTLIVGRPRRLQTFTVLGVLPPTFRFTYPQETEAWAMSPWPNAAQAGVIGYWTVARLEPSVTLASAQTRVAAIRTAIARANETADNREIYTLEPITTWVVGATRPSLILLASVALLLLVITCATVASALFVRAAERQRELAIRASLGADRRRLITQLLAEGCLLAVAGAALGALSAALLAPVLRTWVPPTVPRAGEIAASLWILTFFAAAASVTTVLAVIAPAWRGTRIDAASALKRTASGASSDRTTSRWRQSLVGVQAAIATALLLAATLLILSFWRLSHVPLGFEGDRVLTLEMRLISPQYMPTQPPAVPGQSRPPSVPAPALVAFQERLLDDVRALPGVLEAGLTSAVPFRGVDFVFVLNRVGETRSVVGNARFVDPGYFSVLRVPIVAGRLFTNEDTATSPRVVAISASYAHQMFGTENPLGKLIEGDSSPLEVVGVVADMRYQGFDRTPFPAIYFPRTQSPNELICLVARTAPNAGDLGPPIRALVHRLDPDLPAMNLATIDQIVSDSVADRRFYTTATATFAGLALMLTIMGLVVVISRTVVERRRELAIRTALGATAARQIRLVLGQALVPIVGGVVTGLGAVFLSAGVLRRFLFDVGPRAPLAFVGVSALIVVVAILAALIPARRAARSAAAPILKTD